MRATNMSECSLHFFSGQALYNFVPIYGHPLGVTKQPLFPPPVFQVQDGDLVLIDCQILKINIKRNVWERVTRINRLGESGLQRKVMKRKRH